MTKHPLPVYLAACLALFVGLLLSPQAQNPNMQVVLYILSYLLPIAACFLLVKQPWKHCPLQPWRMTKSAWTLTAVAAPFVVACVLLCALLSAQLRIFAGVTAPAGIPLTAWSLLRHALLPAVAEEVFFRLLPLYMFEPKQRTGALVLSIIAFSLFHMDGYRFLYAASAALLFLTVDLACGSLAPSVLMHIGINALSLVYDTLIEQTTRIIVFAVLVALGIVSGICLFLHRKRLFERIKSKLNFTQNT